MTTIGTIDKPTSYIDENGMKVTRIPCVYGCRASVKGDMLPKKGSYSEKKMDQLFGSEIKTCPECGKTFLMSPEHMYHLKVRVPNSAKKTRKRYYCSYNCWVKANKKTGRW